MCEFCSISRDDDEDEGGAAASRQREALYSRNYSGPFRKTPGRLLGMGFIRLYQLTLSGFIGNSCRHIPTCSEYGYEAVARHGLWSGGWMTLFRVARCGPGGTSGLDPVPGQLGARLHWWTPWRYFALGRKRAER
ncbi:MAG: membrane protein insertion efficiency factor YidD [Rhizobium sp.]|uniref:membrane protein insertion efficiency factor YidD n=1 Tax=Rhizobium sp. TaxID=391 RepID=UPI000647CEE5